MKYEKAKLVYIQGFSLSIRFNINKSIFLHQSQFHLFICWVALARRQYILCPVAFSFTRNNHLFKIHRCTKTILLLNKNKMLISQNIITFIQPNKVFTFLVKYNLKCRKTKYFVQDLIRKPKYTFLWRPHKFFFSKKNRHFFQLFSNI